MPPARGRAQRVSCLAGRGWQGIALVVDAWRSAPIVASSSTALCPLSHPLPTKPAWPARLPADITVRLLLSIDRQQDGTEAMDTAQLAVRLAGQGAPVAGVALTGNPSVGEVCVWVPGWGGASGWVAAGACCSP